jgi:hypothetical protein
VQPDAFPRDALDANRAGRLTPDQSALFRTEASTDRKNLLVAGLAIVAFGAVIVFGALTGRIPGGRLEPLLVGAGMIAFGVIVAFFGGVRGSRAKAKAADAGRVTSLEGPFRRERVDRSAGLFGDDSSHSGTGNEYDYFLFVGDRRFSVAESQWEAAPEDGVVRVYLLGDSDRIVNLERIADAPPPQVPGFVRFALERAAASPDADRAAQARAMLQQADAMTAAAASTVAAGSAAAGSAAPGPVAAGPVAGAPVVPLEHAILGTWRSDLAGMTFDFRADGSVTATSARHDAGEQRWSMAGPDALRLDDATVPAVVVGDVLTLGRPPQSLTFRRVA